MLVPFVILLFTLDIVHAASQPHIIVILADDLGWNDVSFHGSNQFMTPNIDALAYSGVILQDYYTQPLCTPARAALLTGRHPIHNGMQHDVIYAPQPWGLPLSERIIPQYLKSHGYVTRAIGKWHLGHFKAAYTPTKRGFDSYYGCWLGHQNYYTHMAFERQPGYDFHRNLNISWEAKGKYNTDLFTEEAVTIINNHNKNKPLFLYLAHTAPHSPLQAPMEVIDKYKYILQKRRRKYAAMIDKLDESVGRVTQALHNTNMLNNSIILFLSDNGGASHGYNGNVASNWPLRGGKDTLWEGGVRGVGLIWSPLLSTVPRVHRGLVSVQDWLPTILSVISSDKNDLTNVDGVNQWAALNNNSPAPCTMVLHNIDPSRNTAALRFGKWKIVIGRSRKGHFDGWYGKNQQSRPYDFNRIITSASGTAVMTTSSPLPEPRTMHDLRKEATVSCFPHKYKDVTVSQCKPHRSPCLFNIEQDPCELNNVANKHPKVIKQMMSLMKKYHLVKPHNAKKDLRSYPHFWNDTWVTWQDFV